MKKYFGVVLLMLFAGTISAQGLLKGTVRESASGNKLPDVFIRDNANKENTLTEKDGSFVLKTAVGHLLVITSPGYISDTLYVIDMKPKKIELKSMSIALREVNINSSKSFDPRAEFPEVYEKSKVYVFSPSTWFSQDGKRARRLKKYFATEEQERHVDEVYTRVYVGSIVPLKGEELENFMTLYRPTYAFLRNNNGPSLVAYINDSYKKYQALPPEQRKLQSLTNPGQ
jgi:hypothetical protein